MSDGVPVKKRWKIDFSSVCSKNVVSFSKAMKGSTIPSDKSQADGSVELVQDQQLPVVDLDVKAPKSNEVENHNSFDSDKRKELPSCVEPSKTINEKVLGDFSYEKYKPLEGPDDEEEELDYNELDDDMIHRTKFLGIADVGEMEAEETSSDDDEDEAEESKEEEEEGDEDEEEEDEDEEHEEEEEEDSDKEDGNVNEVHEKEKEKMETEAPDKETDVDVNKSVHTEEVYHEEKQEVKEEEEMDNEKMEEVSKEDSDKSLLNTSLCFELDGGEEFKEDISIVDETETSDKISIKEENSAADSKSDRETTAASRVELFEPLSPLQMDETKTNEDQNNHFNIKIVDLDLDDPSSPPLVVSKPADMKPIVKTRVTKKKKVMVIQTYNSGSEEEPEVKVRPQRRSKPSMMDLRDQHRIFNTTSFVKERNASNVDTNGTETPPEPYHPPQPAASTASQHGHAPVSVSKEEGTTHTRLPTSSSDDAEDSLPLSQFVPKKASSDKEDTKEDRKVLKKVKKRKLKKKKKDPDEPQKPVSAYALFFRDMQSSIKAEKPDASFGEISKIVANQWDALEGQKKTDYKKKTETAKKEYLKRLAAYKANKISSEPLPLETTPKQSPVPVTTVSTSFVPPSPALSGHLYSIQQSQQLNSSTTKSKPHHLHEEQQRQEPTIPTHHTSSNSRLDFASDGPAQGNYQPAPRIPSISSVLPSKPGICVNEGCTNLAIEDNRWDREYCSTECVVQHCRDAFQSWVMQRQDCFNDSTTAIY